VTNENRRSTVSLVAHLFVLSRYVSLEGGGVQWSLLQPLLAENNLRLHQ